MVAACSPLNFAAPLKGYRDRRFWAYKDMGVTPPSIGRRWPSKVRLDTEQSQWLVFHITKETLRNRDRAKECCSS